MIKTESHPLEELEDLVRKRTIGQDTSYVTMEMFIPEKELHQYHPLDVLYVALNHDFLIKKCCGTYDNPHRDCYRANGTWVEPVWTRPYSILLMSMLNKHKKLTAGLCDPCYERMMQEVNSELENK